jgi:antirestriction protein
MSRVLCLDEEYFITDSEDIPFEVSEFSDPFQLNEQLEQYEALGESEKLCVAFLLSEGHGWQHALDHHEDVILYSKESMEDVAYTLVEIGCFGAIPESLSNYIDYEAIARDLGYDGYVEREEGVFYYAE